MRWWMGAFVGLLIVSLGPLGIAATDQRLLPAFRVVAPDGTAVQSRDLSRQDRWLLIYAVPDCQPCDQMLRALKRWQSPRLPERTVLVIGAQAAAAQAYLEKQLPVELRGIPWYADAQGEAWQALGMTGTPLLIGIRRGRIEWVISGVLKDPATLTSAVRTWVEY